MRKEVIVMNIEEIAFKDRKNLVQLNENDLLDVIEFLQNDRKQWINQFTQAHNESVKIQEKNQELKDELKNKPDAQITLKDDKGNKFTLIQTERIDMQVELNKTIEKLFNNWNKLKEYIRKNIIYDDVGMKILDPSPLEDYIQELEQGSYEED